MAVLTPLRSWRGSAVRTRRATLLRTVRHDWGLELHRNTCHRCGRSVVPRLAPNDRIRVANVVLRPPPHLHIPP